LKEPKTWNEFINICNVLKKNKVTVFSQGSLAVWTLYEIIYSGLGANFYGGEESRQKLMAGKLKLTSPPFVKAFKKINQLKKYFPENYKYINYTAMQQFFINGKAAMFIGGSWELALFKEQNMINKLDWFAPPVEKTGDPVNLCFHVDAGISLNKNSKHPKEALLFLKWTASPEYAKLFMDNLPGFITYTKGDFKINNRIAAKMVNTAKNSKITIRTVWEKLSDQSPTGNQMLAKAIQQMYNNKLTPEQAAKFVQDKLEVWYIPFKK
jgi:raffinose/stachyose/melibiose transport system substrate-binding protein